MESSWTVIFAVVGVGLGLATLIWRLQQDTSRRIAGLEDRMQAVETGLAELKGFINGLTKSMP